MITPLQAIALVGAGCVFIACLIAIRMWIFNALSPEGRAQEKQ